MSPVVLQLAIATYFVIGAVIGCGVGVILTGFAWVTFGALVRRWQRTHPKT